ncbi:MAG: Ig-like domain-containing protein [Anaerolineae bacterium]|nr:Ig-like domain-containing protein [Anaerolineae bacterium]
MGPLSLTDGIQTLQVRASDLAGQVIFSEQINAKVDSTPPSLTVSKIGTLGSNGWYISETEVSVLPQDATSGVAATEYSLNNGAWQPYTFPLALTDGTHSLNFWMEDNAGWITEVTDSVRVDTRPPQIGGSILGTSGMNGWYTSAVTFTASASDPLPGSGLDTFRYTLNGSLLNPYTAPLTLSDGQHSLTLNARDLAGLESTSNQTVWVDTLPPGLQIQTTLPVWVQDTLTLQGAASDGGSGLQRVEISFDNGQTWLVANGTTDWSLDWDTRKFPSSGRTLYVRSVDKAGLSTILPLSAQVDNTPPQIQLPGQWEIWDSVTFDARDADSGLVGAELVISDPQNRWPKRVYNYAPGHLPLTFQWDRRFGDGTLAPMGSYDVNATATDRMGNTRKVTASIRILIVLPPQATSTPLGTPLPTATLTAAPSALPTLIPTSTATSGTGVTVFGATEVPGNEGSLTATPTLIPRAAPTESTFSGWIESIFNPQPTPQASSVTFTHQPPQSAQADGMADSILWGAAATASVGAFAAYIAQKKREEEEAAARRQETTRQRRMTPEERKAQELKSAIAAVTAKERQDWESERKKKIANETGYAALKGVEQQQYVKQRLDEIRQDEAEWRAEQKRKEQARLESELESLEQADVSEAERWEAYTQSPGYQQREQERLALLNWILTGKNPPAGMEDVSEAERLEMYQKTHAYQSRQEQMAEWEDEQERQKLADVEKQKQAREDANRAYAALREKGQSITVAAPQEKTWWQGDSSKMIDSIIGLGANFANSTKDVSTMIASSIVLTNSTKWLLSPSTDPNPFSRQIQETQLLKDVSRGLINDPDDFITQFNNLDQSKRVLNYTTLADMVDGAKKFVPSVAGVASFGLSVTGMATGNKDMQAIGDTSGGVLNILQGFQTWGNQAVIAESTKTLAGRILLPVQGVLGGLQYGSSLYRLANDQSINPNASGQWDNTAWIERVGVTTTGIGGIFLAAGAFTAIFGGPAGIAVAAVLVPAGLAFTGAGAIMQNWGWVTSTINDISGAAQNWLSSDTSGLPNSSEVPAAPVPTPALFSSPTATPSSPAATSGSATESSVVSPASEVPAPSPSPTPTETPHP